MLAIYTRVSTGLQVLEGTSLEGQFELCLKKALELGFTRGEISLYQEEGLTGEELDRPALNRLREDVARGGVTHVICTHPDRLSRDLTDKLIICREFEKRGVKLHFVDTDYQNTPEGQLFFNIQSVIAQYELSLIRKRTVRGRLDTVRKKQRVMPMRVPPFGYDLRDGRLEVNQKEAQFVRLVYNWYVYDRLTMREIGTRLTELGCYPKRCESRLWNVSSIRRILTSEIYIGRYYYNRRRCYRLKEEKTPGEKPRRKFEYRPPEEWIEVTVPAIVDERLFEEAQRQKVINRKGRGGQVRHEYLLRSLLKCGRCGHAWTATNYPGTRGKSYPVYRCGYRYPRRYGKEQVSGCNARTIRADWLDGYVWNLLSDLVLDPRILRLTWQNREQQTATILEQLLEALNRELEAKEREKERVRLMFIRGASSLEEMSRDLARVKAELEKLQDEARRVRARLQASLAGPPEGTQPVPPLVNPSFQEKRQVVELLISGITVEVRGNEAVLTFRGILDELLKQRLCLQSPATSR